MNKLTTAELRKFAWVMTGALTVFGGLWLLGGSQRTAIVCFTIAGLFVAFGLIVPSALAPVHRAWMMLGHVLAWINTRIILGLFYYLLMTPISLVMRLLRRDMLKRKMDRSRSTYWHIRSAMKSAKDSYEHLY